MAWMRAISSLKHDEISFDNLSFFRMAVRVFSLRSCGLICGYTREPEGNLG
jgi:hypothetical protein